LSLGGHTGAAGRLGETGVATNLLRGILFVGERIGIRLPRSDAERRMVDRERVEIDPIAVYFLAEAESSKDQAGRDIGLLRVEPRRL
jgi:hypothetical protein